MTTTFQRPLNQIPAREWRSKYLEIVDWNAYQQRIFDWVQNGSGNSMVGAVAGSGKTSSITGIVAALPASAKIQIVAFNRHIAQKLKDDSRIPKGRVTVSTAHSWGKSILTGYFGGKLFDPDERKYFHLAKDAVQQLLRERVDFDNLICTDPEAAALRYPVPPPPLTEASHNAEVLAKEIRRFIQNVVRFAQMTLTPLQLENLVGMVDHFGIEVPNAKGVLEWGIYEAIKVLDLGENLAANQQRLDFGDMLWLPNKWDLKPASKQFCIVDEAQDANAAMIGLYQRVVDQGARLILLGDERQAIFGFSGSDANSWQSLREAFNPIELPLSVCYRCPSSHLDLARRIVPVIENRPNAPEGVLEVLHPDRVFELVAPDDLILCRLTAPLIELCLKLIIRGEHARVRGRNLGKQLANLSDTAAGDRAYPGEFQQALDSYCFPKIKALFDDGEDSEAESLSDRRLAITTCFESFGRECQTLEEFCERIKSLFTDDEAAIILATIHRAKGDEADRVFLLGTNLLPFLFKSTKAWQIKQEWNLVYVSLTRAKKHLYLVPLARTEKDKEHLPRYLKHPLGGMQLPADPTIGEEEPEEEPEALEEAPIGNGDDGQNKTELTSLSYADHLADLIRQAPNWAEVESAIATHPEHKAEAWQMFDASEKARIKALKDQACQVALNEVPPMADKADQSQQLAAPDPAEALVQTAVETLSPQSVALKVLECGSWEEFEWLLDAVGAKVGKSRVMVYKYVLKNLSIDDRQHLVKLLATHIQQFPRDRWAYSWLPGSSIKLVDKARAAASNQVVEVAEVGLNEDDYFDDPEA